MLDATLAAPAVNPGELALIAIQSWPQATLFLGPELGTVAWMNPMAERCLREHGATLTGGRIQLAQRERQRDFEGFLSIAGQDVQSWVLDLPGEADALVFRCRLIGDTGYRILTVFHPENPPTAIPDVGPMFGLTPSESRILAGLIGGRRADDQAGELGVSIETVRTHIRRIYNKLGVASREQLIAKVSAYRVP